MMMTKKILNLSVLLMLAAALSSCQKSGEAPEVSQPIITQYAAKAEEVVGGETIAIGPIKDYEQESEVVYKLVVSSELPLTKFMVKTSSDVFSLESRVVKTEPANALDEQGNFIQELKNVTVYYAYKIDPAVAPLSIVTVTFTFQNKNNFAGSSSNTFTTIKKGSTSGKRLTVIDMPGYSSARYAGIGNQDNLDIVGGIRTALIAAGVDLNYRKGPFFSIEMRSDMVFSEDAVLSADKIDFVGYRTKVAGTNPVLNNGSFYLVSPSDTTVLTSTFAGAIGTTITLTGNSGTADITVGKVTRLATYVSNPAQTATNFVNAHKAAYTAVGLNLSSNGANLVWNLIAKNTPVYTVKAQTLTGNLSGNEVRDVKLDLLAAAIRKIAAALPAGKELRKVYFKRLDNITGDNRVTAATFDQLTHDSEFDVLLADIEAEGRTSIGPVVHNNEVYGFVMDDGRRGLIKTSPATSVNPSGATNPTNSTTASDGVLFCTIKVQENK
ncbi:MAG: hypothetical protein EOP49_07780 [Sphingobacteriales bacterium]|nr:MAG: hypothetical protein EOP49_07780 [Sphingobacteriales bacterium]